MAANTQLLFAEDKAMKEKLSGLFVPSSRGQAGHTDVGVWFRWPEREYGEGLFPFITLDLIDVQFDRERAHSFSYDVMEYIPDDTPNDAANAYMAAFPVPLTMTYMVATHCRNARHDRELFRQLMQTDYLPWRFGYLEVTDDDTVRRLDVLDISANTDYDSLKKRVFRRIWTIGVSAEMLPENWSTPTPEIDTTIHLVDIAVVPEQQAP